MLPMHKMTKLSGGEWLQAPIPDPAPAAEEHIEEALANNQMENIDLNQEPVRPEVMEVDVQEAPQENFDLNMLPSESESNAIPSDGLVQWPVLEEEVEQVMADHNIPLQQDVQLPLAELQRMRLL